MEKRRQLGKRGRSQVSEKDSDVRDLPRVSSVLGLKERLRKEQVQEKWLWFQSPMTRRQGKKGNAATQYCIWLRLCSLARLQSS